MDRMKGTTLFFRKTARKVLAHSGAPPLRFRRAADIGNRSDNGILFRSQASSQMKRIAGPFFPLSAGCVPDVFQNLAGVPAQSVAAGRDAVRRCGSVPHWPAIALLDSFVAGIDSKNNACHFIQK